MRNLTVIFVFALGMLLAGPAFGTTYHSDLLGDTFTGDSGKKGQNSCETAWVKSGKKVKGMVQWTCESFDGPGALDGMPASVLVDKKGKIKMAAAIGIFKDEESAKKAAMSLYQTMAKDGCKSVDSLSKGNTVAVDCPEGQLDYTLVVRKNMMIVMYMNSLRVLM